MTSAKSKRKPLDVRTLKAVRSALYRERDDYLQYLKDDDEPLRRVWTDQKYGVEICIDRVGALISRARKGGGR